ncbi:hypothetical protein, partial [Pseudomonas sp. HY13-MNA-CIBAN-0226]|uniref:hypothetical protein n=1 Tax=Pseudomonas sp. HY13-MNA-CIBAN-0226 TaxID=3140473 RepID=UPI003333A0E7
RSDDLLIFTLENQDQKIVRSRPEPAAAPTGGFVSLSRIRLAVRPPSLASQLPQGALFHFAGSGGCQAVFAGHGQ